MRTLIFKLNCLLLVVRSVAQSDPYSLVPIPSYLAVTSDDTSLSPQLGDDQLGNIAFDSTSPPTSNLASPVAEERIAQCPTIKIHQRSRKLRQREESCPNPLANPLNGKIVPANEKKKYTSDRPWWQRLWRADDPEPDPSCIYDETEPYQADEETCPNPSRRFPVCTTYGSENLYPPPANMLKLPSCRIRTSDPSLRLVPQLLWREIGPPAQRYMFRYLTDIP